jgi:hypothetical protein
VRLNAWVAPAPLVREVALHFVLLTQEFGKAKTCVIGAVFCSETLTTYKKLVTNQKEFFTNAIHQQTKFVCIARQCTGDIARDPFSDMIA